MGNILWGPILFTRWPLPLTECGIDLALSAGF